MQHKNKRALSVQIPELIIQDDDIFVDYCFYFALHNSHTGGVTKNYRSKFNEIASRLNIHPNTVRKYVGRICQRGWAWRSQKDLYTLSQGKLKEQFGLENKKCVKFSIHTTDFKLIQIAIRAKRVETNLTQQEYAVKQNEFTFLAKKYFGNLKVNELSKSNISLIEKKLKQYSANNTLLLNNDSYDITVSKKKIASLINRKSAFTGTRFMRKAEMFFNVEKRTKTIYSNVSRHFFERFRENYTGNKVLFYFNGRIFERSCDKITFKYINKVLK